MLLLLLLLLLSILVARIPATAGSRLRYITSIVLPTTGAPFNTTRSTQQLRHTDEQQLSQMDPRDAPTRASCCSQSGG